MTAHFLRALGVRWECKHNACAAEMAVPPEGREPVDGTFHVYMLVSTSGVLYVGVTSKLARRVWQHKQKGGSGFHGKI
jgi:hypothetical protein